MQSLLATLALIAIASISKVSGNSAGTGSCDPGIASIENTVNPTNTHIQYAQFPGSTSTRDGGRGTLEQALTTITVNGQTIVPNTPISFPSGTDLVWTITATRAAYKGIFVRVEKSSDDFTHVPNDAVTLQNVVLCDAFTGVIGVTQLNSAPKITSAGTMNFASTGSVTMDVILVFDNIASSVYTYDGFQLTIEDSVAPVTPSPVVPPVAVPTATTAPATTAPAGIPTATTAPVIAPITTDSPVAAPTVTDPPGTDPPSSVPPTTDECPGEGKGKGGMMMGEGSGKGKGSEGSGKMKKKGKKCKVPKEPKTPKAGKGMGKGKGGETDDDSVRR